ncbi:FAD-dependent oxidoreductase [Pseudonocardia acaciae]|uniref:oxidoreductase n=1 Tax=Pseudonocardia acaciae TaxID=551276 RepID=UPI00048BF39B|nr:FAD-dependent oxidoreductase [Pseudonocardia acaciae]
MSVLGTPLRLGRRTLRNRIVAAPMERNYCDLAGAPTPHYADRLAAAARGGSALVFSEASYVRADGKVRPRQLAADDDRAVPGLRRLADAVHAHGALFGMQLVHGGRLSRAAVTGLTPVAPSPVVAEVVQGDLPDELDAADIADLVERFGAAARRSVLAGADVLSIHAAHGYLLAQFLSPRTNRRRDAYRDPRRFLAEVVTAVRAAAPDAVVGIRVSAYEGVDDGLTTEQTLGILADAGTSALDFVDVSAGCYEAGQWITPSGELPRGLHADTARRFRALGVPVGVAGRIVDGTTAESIVAGGKADFVSVARAVHADPEWAAKTLRGADPRPCISCNYCADALRGGEPVGCAVNPEAAGPLPLPAPGGSAAAVLVVGAGPAGLEAARLSAAAGRATRLVDASDRLGGSLGLAADLHEYPEYHRAVDWYATHLADLGVVVELERTLTPTEIADQPEDVVVIATGLPGVVPPVAGDGVSRVQDLTTWLRTGPRDGLEPEYVVWGADRDATAVADHLAARGARVTMIGTQAEPAEEVGPRAKLLPLARLRHDPKVRLEMNATVESVGERDLSVRDADGFRTLPAAGPVLVSLGKDGAAGFARLVGRLAQHKTVVAVGDAAGRGGWAATAVRHAAETVTALVTGPSR